MELDTQVDRDRASRSRSGFCSKLVFFTMRSTAVERRRGVGGAHSVSSFPASAPKGKPTSTSAPTSTTPTVVSPAHADKASDKASRTTCCARLALVATGIVWLVLLWRSGDLTVPVRDSGSSTSDPDRPAATLRSVSLGGPGVWPARDFDDDGDGDGGGVNVGDGAAVGGGGAAYVYTDSYLHEPTRQERAARRRLGGDGVGVGSGGRSRRARSKLSLPPRRCRHRH